ncbi:MAG TPA: SpoIIE family protein phosphatase [Candidatus Eisenbacteria bacterium]|nr:SpoIIE family protein phosphatase [Candidatus Eisenbacteria bacterium]
MERSDTEQPRVPAQASAPNVANGDADVLRTFASLGPMPADAPASSEHFDELLRSATRQVRRIVDCQEVRIWVLRRGGRRLVARRFDERGGDLLVELRYAPDEGLAGWAIAHEQTLRLGPGDARPPLAGPPETFQSALVIPLFRRGEAFGAIECLDRRGAPAFTDADFDRLDVAAEHVAFALDNALLYDETEKRALEKEVLLEAARTLSTPLELDEVIEAIFKALRQVVRYDAVAIYLVNKSTLALELVSEVGYPGGSESAFRLQVGQGIVGWVAKTGEAVIVPDVSKDARYVVARPSTRSELAAPLLIGGRTIGVFNLESDTSDEYHEGHLELLAAFASHAAIAVERARTTRELLERRRLEKELAIARDIQRSFLPERAPELPGFDLAGATFSHDEVGGDYFDFIRVSDSRIGLAIADVSGKGIPASLIMAGFRMTLLAQIRNEFAIGAAMRKANSLLYESTERDKFVTAFYGVLDVKHRVLNFTNAGHNPPLLRRADGSLEALEEGGMALGVLPDARYEERPLALRPGDVLVMFTDGVSEAQAPSGELFGERRLEQCLERLADRSAREILDGIVQEARAWAGERGLSDDLTVMVLKVKERA